MTPLLMELVLALGPILQEMPAQTENFFCQSHPSLPWCKK